MEHLLRNNHVAEFCRHSDNLTEWESFRAENFSFRRKIKIFVFCFGVGGKKTHEQ